MSYTILSTDRFNKTVNVSFNSMLNPQTLAIPKEFWNLDYTVQTTNPALIAYINGFTPSGSFVNSEVARLRELSRNRKPIRMYVPQYLQNSTTLMEQINVQVALGRIILLNETNKVQSEYIILQDWEQDLIAHSGLTASNSDSYIYLRNRFVFLTHLNNLIKHVMPWKETLNEIDTSLVKLVPINFIVPKNRNELESFLEDNKGYIISPSLSKFSTANVYSKTEVLELFIQEYFTQNMETRNLMSMRQENQVYIVEEAPSAEIKQINGVISRPVETSDQPTYRYAGALVNIDDTYLSSAEYFAFLWFLQYTFFYFATPVTVSYSTKVVSGVKHISVFGLDMAVNLEDPKISEIYCN